jgi:hypothetical protein
MPHKHDLGDEGAYADITWWLPQLRPHERTHQQSHEHKQDEWAVEHEEPGGRLCGFDIVDAVYPIFLG